MLRSPLPFGSEVLSDPPRVRQRYLDYIQERGLGYEAINSGSRENQIVRFDFHSRVVSPQDFLLDVGCGIGEFRRYTLAHGHVGSYVGYDIVPPFVDYCRANYSGTFEVRNLIENPPDFEVDVLVASQVFNTRYRVVDNLEMIRFLLDWAKGHVRRAVSMDFLTDQCSFKVSYLYHYSPSCMMKLFSEYGRVFIQEPLGDPWEFGLCVVFD